MQKRRASFILLVISLLLTNQLYSQNAIKLDGEWQLQLDLDDVGLQNEWYNQQFSRKVLLPGSLMEQNIGFAPTLDTKWTGSIYDSSWFFNPELEKFREPGKLHFPFWLTPETYYCGPAWYQREVVVPENWNGNKIELFLERPHWETMVFVNGVEAGMQNSLSTPHVYDLTSWLKAGKNTLTIRVDNRIKEINVGPDSHSITDHTQGNWNGIVGDISLRCFPFTFIEKIKVYPDVEGRKVKIIATIRNSSEKNQKATIAFEAFSFNSSNFDKTDKMTIDVELEQQETKVETTLQFGEGMQLWDEFHPALYRLKGTLESSDGVHTAETSFGMHKFEIDGTVFTSNGRKVFLRGNVDCAAFPQTGYPPTDVISWQKIYRTAKSYGLNHMRFHSWCPPKAAFEAADLEGFYLQPEGPSWANHGTKIGDGLPIDNYLFDECERIIDHYGNHPSFCMMAYGNEPAGRNQVEYLTRWVNHFKTYDNTKLYTSASIGRSWPLCPASEFIVRSEPRGLPWDQRPHSLFNYSDKLAPYSVPYIAHEMGQYCVFPNFDEIKKYSGVYKAKNFELFRELLNEKNMGTQARDFTLASGKFQAICYKTEIEAALRTPGFAGFQLLGLNDFPGQGSAIVGVLDAFYEEKPYIDSTEFNRFCAPTVLLAKLPKFVYTNKDTLRVDFEISHFGEKALTNEIFKWYLFNAHDNLAEGDFSVGQIKSGEINPVGSIDVPLYKIETPAMLTLQVSCGNRVNEWNIWVYPTEHPMVDVKNVYVCHRPDKKAVEILKKGGKVMILASGNIENGKDIVQYFRPVFWNTSWFQMKPPNTTGILCNPEHPALKHFPTEFHSDMQWWELLEKQQVMNLDLFPTELTPIVQPIDTWFLNRKLGLVFEAKVGKGRLLVCSADLTSDISNRPAARQLYYSLFSYVASDAFHPKTDVRWEVVEELFEVKQRKGVEFYTKDSPDELKPKK